MEKALNAVTVVPYRREFRAAFERLNRDWIETFFVLEPADREIFSDPEGHILASGGEIFLCWREARSRGPALCSGRDRKTARSPKWRWRQRHGAEGMETC